MNCDDQVLLAALGIREAVKGGFRVHGEHTLVRHGRRDGRSRRVREGHEGRDGSLHLAMKARPDVHAVDEVIIYKYA